MNAAQQVKIGQVRRGSGMTVLIVQGFGKDEFVAISLKDSKYVKRFEWNTWSKNAEVICDVYPEVIDVDFEFDL